MIGISRLYCGAISQTDHLRYGAGGLGRPAVGLRGPVVVWNCTARCNLRCAHCYSSSTSAGDIGDITTAQARTMIDDLARFDCPVLLFSGGEPLLRDDVSELVACANSLGMRTALSTNGTLITAQMARTLASAGLDYAGISIDGSPATNDSFRGAMGAFDAAVAGVRNCLGNGIKAGLRMTMTAHNVQDIATIFDLVRREGIPRVCFYHLAPAGRALELSEAHLTHSRTRDALDLIMSQTRELHSQGKAVDVLTVDNHADGPYVYLRLLREDPDRARQCLDLLRLNKGNSSGQGIACVDWTGDVHPDQFWRTKVVGNVLQRPFSTIWGQAGHPLLLQLRNRREHLRGRCQRCCWLDVCNGNLRVRAEAAGDMWGDDPACYLSDQEISLDIRNG